MLFRPRKNLQWRRSIPVAKPLNSSDSTRKRNSAAQIPLLSPPSTTRYTQHSILQLHFRKISFFSFWVLIFSVELTGSWGQSNHYRLLHAGNDRLWFAEENQGKVLRFLLLSFTVLCLPSFIFFNTLLCFSFSLSSPVGIIFGFLESLDLWRIRKVLCLDWSDSLFEFPKLTDL